MRTISELRIAGAVTAVASALLAASNAYAGCPIDGSDRGIHPDEYGGTKFNIRNQARNTWDDWVWRGNSEGQRAYCNPAGGANCTYEWDRFKSVTVWKSQGFQVNGGIFAGKATKHFTHVSAVAGFNRQWNSSTNNTEWFGYEIPYPMGTYIEPIIVQRRRWTDGTAIGGWRPNGQWVQRGIGARKYRCYDFDSNIALGNWTDNLADGSSFRSYHISRSVWPASKPTSSR